MNVYDFDNTVYDGETVVDFYLFCLSKKPSLIKYMPVVLSMLVKYKLGRVSEEELFEKASLYSAKIFNSVNTSEKAAAEFWDKHEHKIKAFYREGMSPDDVIVSSSCGFILREICNRLGVKNLVCSEIDPENGSVKRLCFRSNKPIIFKKMYPGVSPDNFFTDSVNDLPMVEISKNAYLVKKNKIKKIK